MSTYSQSGPRAAIFHAPNPVSALLLELQELRKSLELPPNALPTEATFAALREALEARGEVCSQECRRIAVVLSDSQASGAALTLVNIRGLCANVGESVALFTVVSQALREMVVRGCGGVLLPGECFLADLTHGSGGLIGAACEFVGGVGGCLPNPLEEDASVVPITKAASLLPLVARVQQWSGETLRKLPKTVASAVKRRFLSTSVTLKRSAVDVKEETGVETTTTSGTASSSSTPSTPFPSPAAGAAVVRAAITLFKASHTLVAATASLCDFDVEGVAGVGDTTTTTTTTLDTLAKSVEPVENGAIDLAAAVSDAYTFLTGEEEEEEDGDDFDEFDEDEEDEEEEEEEGEGKEKNGAGGGNGVGSSSSSLAQTLEGLEETLGPYLLSLEDLGRTAEACLATLQSHGKGGEGAGTAVQAALVAARECGKSMATALQRSPPS